MPGAERRARAPRSARTSGLSSAGAAACEPWRGESIEAAASATTACRRARRSRGLADEARRSLDRRAGKTIAVECCLVAAFKLMGMAFDSNSENLEILIVVWESNREDGSFDVSALVPD
jgi:hypothetical protein